MSERWQGYLKEIPMQQHKSAQKVQGYPSLTRLIYGMEGGPIPWEPVELREPWEVLGSLGFFKMEPPLLGVPLAFHSPSLVSGLQRLPQYFRCFLGLPCSVSAEPGIWALGCFLETDRSSQSPSMHTSIQQAILGLGLEEDVSGCTHRISYLSPYPSPFQSTIRTPSLCWAEGNPEPRGMLSLSPWALRLGHFQVPSAVQNSRSCYGPSDFRQELPNRACQKDDSLTNTGAALMVYNGIRWHTASDLSKGFCKPGLTVLYLPALPSKMEDLKKTIQQL